MNNHREFEDWMDQVRAGLRSVNMAAEDWQGVWPFDFRGEYEKGTTADDAAMKATRFWWLQQNKSLKQDCRATPACWLPRGHQGECQPVPSGATQLTYDPGDYVKVEFSDESSVTGEWMWLRVNRCDDQKEIVFGTLDSEPLNEYGDQIGLGSELAVRFSQIREHRKPTEFTKQ